VEILIAFLTGALCGGWLAWQIRQIVPAQHVPLGHRQIVRIKAPTECIAPPAAVPATDDEEPAWLAACPAAPASAFDQKQDSVSEVWQFARTVPVQSADRPTGLILHVGRRYVSFHQSTVVQSVFPEAQP
jgi:hypothetical protein